MLEIKHLSSGYEGNMVLQDISCQLQSGQKLCILGANGSGKSTLLKAIMGLNPCTGEVLFQGKSLLSMSAKQRAQEMALLSQHSQIEFPYSLWDTVAMGRYCHRKNCFASLQPEERELIDHCIESVGLWAERDNLLSNLSGGQMQRAYLARTFAQDPKIIMLDEPSNHLDFKVELALYDYLNQWVSQGERAIVSVFHDINVVRQFADQVLLLDHGKTLGYGQVSQVLTPENLEQAYEVDVWSYMERSYKAWQR